MPMRRGRRTKDRGLRELQLQHFSPHNSPLPNPPLALPDLLLALERRMFPRLWLREERSPCESKPLLSLRSRMEEHPWRRRWLQLVSARPLTQKGEQD